MGADINIGELHIEGDLVTAILIDEEGDSIELTFNNDGCVDISTKEYTYLTLSRENLEQMQSLLDEAEEYFNS